MFQKQKTIRFSAALNRKPKKKLQALFQLIISSIFCLTFCCCCCGFQVCFSFIAFSISAAIVPEYDVVTTSSYCISMCMYMYICIYVYACIAVYLSVFLLMYLFICSTFQLYLRSLLSLYVCMSTVLLRFVLVQLSSCHALIQVEQLIFFSYKKNIKTFFSVHFFIKK